MCVCVCVWRKDASASLLGEFRRGRRVCREQERVAAQQLGGLAARWLGDRRGCRRWVMPARCARPPCRSRCAAPRRGAGAPAPLCSCAPVLMSLSAAFPLAHNSNTPTARARAFPQNRGVRTMTQDAVRRTAPTPSPPLAPAPTHTNNRRRRGTSASSKLVAPCSSPCHTAAPRAHFLAMVLRAYAPSRCRSPRVRTRRGRRRSPERRGTLTSSS